MNLVNLNWNIIWTIVNLIVLFLLMKHFLFKPVKAMMDKRQQVIVSALKDAEQKQEEANGLKDQYEAELKNAHMEAAKLMQDVKGRAQQEYDNILSNANQDAAKVMEQANRNIALEKAKAMDQIQSEIAGLALAAASKVAAKNMDEETNKQLVDSFLSEAGAGK